MIVIKTKGEKRYAYITTPDSSFENTLRDIVDDIRDSMKVPNAARKVLARSRNPNAKKAAKYMSDFFYPITVGGRFSIGLLGMIVSKIIERYPHLKKHITIDESTMALYRPSNLRDLDIKDEYGEKVLRYYQKEALEAAKKAGRGLLIMGTGAGKSLAIAALIDSLVKKKPDAKILLLVPQSNLVNQFSGDFDDYGVSFTYSMWKNGYPLDKTTNVCIVTHAMVRQRYKKEWDWMKTMDMVISDEVHTVSKETDVSDIIESIETLNKFGFTGTLSKDERQQWHTIGSYGSIIYEKPGVELREENFLTQCTVVGLKITHPVHGHMSFLSECSYISNSTTRNRKICELVKIRNGNFLILVNFIEHGENILRVLKEMYPDRPSYFVTGDTPDEERERIRKEMESRSDCILVAITKIFSTGVNITNLPNIIIAMGGKAYIRLVQTIGRGLRLHADKTRLYIFDFFDNLHYSFSHFQDRREIYEEENIRIVEKDL
jgi:superfamily II DNA or RNA helicase